MDDSSSFNDTCMSFVKDLYLNNDIDIKDAYYSTQDEDNFVEFNSKEKEKITKNSTNTAQYQQISSLTIFIYINSLY